MDVIVGRAQRSDIAIADLAWRGEIVISPIKWFGAIRFEQDIRTSIPQLSRIALQQRLNHALAVASFFALADGLVLKLHGMRDRFHERVCKQAGAIALNCRQRLFRNERIHHAAIHCPREFVEPFQRNLSAHFVALQIFNALAGHVQARSELHG